MNRASQAQLERASRLLAHEGAPDSAGARAATAAGRVYDKLHAHLAPLVGVAGVELMFVRSAKLTQGEFAFLTGISILEGSPKLRERLEDPAVATETVVVLFGTFLTLITTFIGERLTTQLLRRAWPNIEEAAPTETRT